MNRKISAAILLFLMCVHQMTDCQYYIQETDLLTFQLIQQFHVKKRSEFLSVYNKAVMAEAVDTLVLLLAPFIPHVTEELWQAIGHTGSVHKQSWPKVDEKALVAEEVTVIVQINGKIRDKVVMPVDLDKAEAEKLAVAQPKIAEAIAGKEIK